MDIDQAQRRDIDNTRKDRLTLDIDKENITLSPYVLEVKSFRGNNWFNQEDNVVKNTLSEQDSIFFDCEPIPSLSYKNITNIIVEFDYEITRVSINYPILSNISLTCLDMTKYTLVESTLTSQGHIEIDCSLFNFKEDVVNNSITEQGFSIGLNFIGNKSNATIKLSNINIRFEFENILSDEIDSVVNRLEPAVDFYRENNKIILQIGGDASGKGMDHGGAVDTYSKSEIDDKLLSKVNVEIGKGLSSQDYTLTEKVKLQSIQEGANNYTHPSSHDSSMIVEENALPNLQIGANATQSEINQSIDEKIVSSGFSGSYNDLTDVPSEFPPSNHNHTVGDVTDFPIMPSKISDLANDSNFIETSNTIGLVKNDGTIDTTPYLSNLPSHNHDDRYFTESEMNIKLAGKSDNGHTHSGYAPSTHNHDDRYYTESETDNLLNDKLDVEDAFSGSYNDLDDVPDSFNPTSHNHSIANITNLQSQLNSKLEETDVGAVTFSNDYNDLDNRPTIPSTANFIQKSSTPGLIKNDGTVDTTQYLSSLPTHNHDGRYYTETEVDTKLGAKQDTLESGTNIKTINSQSLLGSGNIVIQGGGTGVDIATSWGSPTSDSKVPSERLAKSSLDAKANSNHGHNIFDLDQTHLQIGYPAFDDWGDYEHIDVLSFLQFNLTDGKIYYNGVDDPDLELATKGDIPSLTNYIQKSSTPGLIKNNGTIDTTPYSTFDGNYNNLSNKPTIPSKTSDLINDGDGTNVFVKNNDSRLADSRTPTAHNHLSSDITDLIDIIYPVGYIYMSVNPTSPQTLFGGSWERLKDTFLLACGDTYASDGDNVSTAQHGAATHSLTAAQMPRHTHTQNAHSHGTSTSGEWYVTSAKSEANNTKVAYSSSGNRLVDGQTDTGTSSFHHRGATNSQTPTIKYAGGSGTGESASNGAAHNNMPPYMAVYMWKRIA